MSILKFFRPLWTHEVVALDVKAMSQDDLAVKRDWAAVDGDRAVWQQCDDELKRRAAPQGVPQLA